MSLKKQVFDVLQSVNMPCFYGYSNKQTFPFIRFTLGDYYTKRLSNQKAIKHIWYQIDVFTKYPIDVENGSSVLVEIEEKLEKVGLITSDWDEVIEHETPSSYPVYHYYLRVRS